MQTLLRGVPHKLLFMHGTEDVHELHNGKKKGPVQRRVSRLYLMRMVAEGTDDSPALWETVEGADAIVHPADTFNKATARHLLMSRLMYALQTHGMPREDRRTLGAMFSGRPRGKRSSRLQAISARIAAQDLLAELHKDKLTRPQTIADAEALVLTLNELEVRV